MVKFLSTLILLKFLIWFDIPFRRNFIILFLSLRNLFNYNCALLEVWELGGHSGQAYVYLVVETDVISATAAAENLGEEWSTCRKKASLCLFLQQLWRDYALPAGDAMTLFWHFFFDLLFMQVCDRHAHSVWSLGHKAELFTVDVK